MVLLVALFGFSAPTFAGGKLSRPELWPLLKAPKAREVRVEPQSQSGPAKTMFNRIRDTPLANLSMILCGIFSTAAIGFGTYDFATYVSYKRGIESFNPAIDEQSNAQVAILLAAKFKQVVDVGEVAVVSFLSASLSCPLFGHQLRQLRR